MNSVNLIGNIGRDLELKTTKSSKSVVSFSLAVKGYNKTNWINVVAWQKTAEVICAHCSKGSQIAITGGIDVRDYEDKSGNKRTAVEVIANAVDFIGAKKENNQEISQNDFKDIGDDEDDEFLPF